MIRQIAHICIYTNDLEKTLHFYTQVLGLKKGFEFKKSGELKGYYIELGNNSFIEVFAGSPGEVGNISHVALEVVNMESLISRIRDHGIEISDKKLGEDNTWQVWVTDPNGVRIEFQEYTKESMQLSGGACNVTW